MPLVSEVVVIVELVRLIAQVLRWHQIFNRILLIVIAEHIVLVVVQLPVLGIISKLLVLGLVVNRVVGHSVVWHGVHGITSLASSTSSLLILLLILLFIIIVIVTIVKVILLLVIVIIVKVVLFLFLSKILEALRGSSRRPGLGLLSKQIVWQLNVELDVFAPEVFTSGHPELELMVNVKVDVVFVGFRYLFSH